MAKAKATAVATTGGMPVIPGMEHLPDQEDTSHATRLVTFLAYSVKAGRFKLDGAEIGDEIEVVHLVYRWRAVLWEGGKSTGESFNPESDEYTRIRNWKKGPKSDQKDGPSVGPEVLYWIPSLKRFVILHLKNSLASTINASKACRNRLGRLSAGKPDKHGNRYLDFRALDREVAPENVPTADQAKEAYELFVAPLKEPEGQPAGGRPR